MIKLSLHGDIFYRPPLTDRFSFQVSYWKFFLSFFFLILTIFSTSTAYSQSTGFWKTMPPTPTTRTEVAVSMVNGKIYVIGGFTPRGITSQVDRLDLNTGHWSDVAPLPQPLHHTSASMVNGKIYVIGGFNSGFWTAVATTYEYDPAKDKWHEKRPMPTARGAMAGGVIDGKIYLVGGAHQKLFRLVNTSANELYDPAIDQWRKLKPMLTPRDHLTVSTISGILYAVGGRVNGN